LDAAGARYKAMPEQTYRSEGKRRRRFALPVHSKEFFTRASKASNLMISGKAGMSRSLWLPGWIPAFQK
jgi:hypothetical protein